MTELKNDRFLRALLRQSVDRTPVWMMRQAGRYLPEYRATREQAGSFLDLCKNAELACEVTLQPLRRYPMDAAILFSDILTVPDALGLGLYFEEGEGPRFRKTVRSEADLAGLNAIKADDDLAYVIFTSGSTGLPKGGRTGTANLRYLGRQPQCRRLSGIFPAVYAAGYLTTAHRSGRAQSAGDCVHQGRRPVAGDDCRMWCARGGTRLDHRYRQRPRPGG